MDEAKVIFFPNGNTAVFINDEQSPKHQKSWFLKYVKFLEENGIDVLNSEYLMPDDSRAELIKIGNRYNWKIMKKED